MLDQSKGQRKSRPSSESTDIVACGMAQWRRERPEIDCSGKAIVGRILRLQEVIVSSADKALSPHGLQYSSYAVLATLRVSGAPYRMSPSLLAETLLLSSGGISNLLARLQRQGWVTRRTDPLDGRAVIVQLTRRGKALVEPAMVDHAAAERELVQMLSNDEQQKMAQMLSKVLTISSDPPIATDASSAGLAAGKGNRSSRSRREGGQTVS